MECQNGKMTAYIVKSRLNGKLFLQTISSTAGDTAQAFVAYRRDLNKTNYDWKHYSREYKTVRVELHELA